MRPFCLTAVAALAAAAVLAAHPARAELSSEELAKLAQNPVGNLIFHFGKLPVNTQIGAYYSVARPDNAANWQLRAQVQLMFPK